MVDRPASLNDIVKVPLIFAQASMSLLTGRDTEDHAGVQESGCTATSNAVSARHPGRGGKTRRRSSYLAHAPGFDAGTSNHASTVIARSSSTSSEDDIGIGSLSFSTGSNHKQSVSCADEKAVRQAGHRNTFLQRAATNYGGSFEPKAVENVFQICRMLPQFIALTLAMAAVSIKKFSFHNLFTCFRR